MTTTPPIKVALADDHRLFRDGIKMVLKQSESLSVVWEAANGEELLTKLQQLQPDVLLLDLNMPQIDGISILPIIRRDYEAVKVIILSMDNTPGMIYQMMELGAHSYLSKNVDPEELVSAISRSFSHGYYFTEQINKVFLNQLQGIQREQQVPLLSLSKKERFVLQALAAEKSTEEIAHEGGINPRTIEAIRKRLKTKTGTKTTVGLVLYAMRHNLLQ